MLRATCLQERSCSRSRFARLETDTAQPKPAVAAGWVRMSPSRGSLAGPSGIQRRRLCLGHFEELPPISCPPAADCATLQMGLSHSEASRERMRYHQSRSRAGTPIPTGRGQLQAGRWGTLQAFQDVLDEGPSCHHPAPRACGLSGRREDRWEHRPSAA